MRPWLTGLMLWLSGCGDFLTDTGQRPPLAEVSGRWVFAQEAPVDGVRIAVLWFGDHISVPVARPRSDPARPLEFVLPIRNGPTPSAVSIDVEGDVAHAALVAFIDLDENEKLDLATDQIVGNSLASAAHSEMGTVLRATEGKGLQAISREGAVLNAPTIALWVDRCIDQTWFSRVEVILRLDSWRTGPPAVDAQCGRSP